MENLQCHLAAVNLNNGEKLNPNVKGFSCQIYKLSAWVFQWNSVPLKQVVSVSIDIFYPLGFLGYRRVWNSWQLESCITLNHLPHEEAHCKSNIGPVFYQSNLTDLIPAWTLLLSIQHLSRCAWNNSKTELDPVRLNTAGSVQWSLLNKTKAHSCWSGTQGSKPKSKSKH